MKVKTGVLGPVESRARERDDMIKNARLPPLIAAESDQAGQRVRPEKRPAEPEAIGTTLSENKMVIEKTGIPNQRRKFRCGFSPTRQPSRK